MKNKIEILPFFFLLLFNLEAFSAYTISSPGGKIVAKFNMKNGQPFYSLSFNNIAIIKPSALGLNLEDPLSERFELVEVIKESVETQWGPVWGEYDVIPDNYNSLKAVLKERKSSNRVLIIEMRAYNEGLAFRYHMPNKEDQTWGLLSEKTTFQFKDGSAAYAISRTEEEYPREPILLEDLERMVMTPFTVKLPDGAFASVLEAYVKDYARIGLIPMGNGAVALKFRADKVNGKGSIRSPWRVILMGENEGRLIENQHLIQTLNPSCKIEDTSWIKPGLTISNNRNCEMRFNCLKSIIDMASKHNFRYIQLDWAWYGTEWPWSEAECEEFREHSPGWANNDHWEEIIEANPYTVVKGKVPYRPSSKWKDFSRYVDFEMDELVQYAKEHEMGVCLYVHDRVLREHDLDKLFAHYESWGVAGIKPGFVGYGSADDTEWIRHMVEVAAKHHLWLCIHDDYVPEGMERTYPNLFIAEGGGGQENHYDVHQDVTLPFTRNLAGAFDYTPYINTNRKSHAHGIAFFIVYQGATSVVRGHVREILNQTPAAMGVETEFVKRIPMNWDDTKILDAKIGKHVVIARKNDKTWFIGGLTGSEAYTAPVELDFLLPGKAYTATIYRDSENIIDSFRHVVKESRTVHAGDKLNIDMAKAGGLAVIIE